MLDDIRECPATATLAASWIVVFVAMILVQSVWSQAPAGSLLSPLPVSGAVSHLFGDQTWNEVRRGEWWRTVTATFVHGNLVHLGLNLLGLIQLGRLIEPWYRSGPFFSICLLIGAGGNLVSGLLRQAMITIRPMVEATAVARLWPVAFQHIFSRSAGVDATVHSAGGSTILLGLMTVILVVGWRSRTRMGLYLRDQMTILLVATAGLGLLMAQSIDNYGHAGGAIVGVAVGWLHRPLLRAVEKPWFRRLGWGLGAAIVAWSTLALGRDSAREVRQERAYLALSLRDQTQELILGELPKLMTAYGRVALRSTTDPLDEIAIRDWFGIATLPNGSDDRAALRERLKWFDVSPKITWDPEQAEDLQQIRQVARAALDQPPTFTEVHDLRARAGRLFRSITTDRKVTSTRLTELEAAIRRDH